MAVIASKKEMVGKEMILSNNASIIRKAKADPTTISRLIIILTQTDYMAISICKRICEPNYLAFLPSKWKWAEERS